MIQTEDQYIFCWMTLSDAVEQIKGQKKEAEPSEHYVKLSLLRLYTEN